MPPRLVVLYVCTHGPEDPARALLTFSSAMGAFEAGHLPRVALVGEAVRLLRSDVVESLESPGFPSLNEMLQKAVDRNIPLYISTPCGRAGGLGDAELTRFKARWMDSRFFAELVVAADKVVSL